MSASPVSISELEHVRFGVRTARGRVEDTAGWSDALAFCRDHDVELLVVRVPCSAFEVVHGIEEAGGRLMDTLVFVEQNLERLEDGDTLCPFQIRPLREEDTSAVEEIARSSFRGYFGHYHADPRLSSERADEAYADWALRSCRDRAVADEVLVALEEGVVRGFVTVEIPAPDTGQPVLAGVSPAAQGQGVYRHLIAATLSWARERGLRKMQISTQVTNIAVQKVWARLGFEPSRSYYTFHVWFTPRDGRAVRGTGEAGPT